MAGDEQNRQFGPMRPYNLTGFQAVHHGHGKVHDHDIEAGTLKQVECRSATLGHSGLVAYQLKSAGDHLSHAVIVIHDKRPFAASPPHGGRFGLFSWRGFRSGTRPREIKAHRCTASERAIDGNGSTGLPDHAIDLRKTEPRPLTNILCREEWVECP